MSEGPPSRRPARREAWAARAMGAFAPVFAPAALVLGVAFGARRRPPRAWVAAWILYGVAVAVAAAAAGDPRTLVLGVLQAALAIVAATVFAVPRRPLAEGLATGLVASAILLALVHVAAPWSWSTRIDDDALSAWVRRAAGAGEASDVTRRRTWHVPPDAVPSTVPTRVSVDVHLLEGREGWGWWWSGDVQVHPRPSEGPDAARIDFAPSGSPYAQRWRTLREPVGGRTFRASVDLRGSAPPTDTTCRGLRLQVFGEGGGSSCAPLEPSSEWRRASLTWTVPEGATSRTVRLVLHGFAGGTLDVRDATLEEVVPGEGIRSLTPLVPQAMDAEFAWRSETTSGSVHTLWSLSGRPSQRSLDVPEAARTPGTRWTLTLRPAPGTTFAVGDVRWDGTAPQAVAPSLRPGLLARHANALGHGAAVAAVGGMALTATASWPFLASAAGGGLVVLLTGGRAATAAFLVGALVLLLIRFVGARRSDLAWASVATVVGIGTALFLGRDALPFNVGGLSERAVIWRGAWEAFVAHPWTGLTGQGTTFSDWWSAFGTTQERVTHAHNQPLDLLARYGLLGGVAALAWLAASVHVLVRRRHLERLAVVVALLAVASFDATMLGSFVLVPWVMLLVARGNHEGDT